MVLEKTLESPLDCKEIQPVHSEGNQSWIFIGRTNVATEVLISGHLMRRANSLEKTLMLGKIEGRRRRGRQRMRWLDGITNSVDLTCSGSWWWTGRPGMLQSMRSQRVGHDWVTELNWMKSEKVGRISSWNRVLLKDCEGALKKSLWFYVPEVQRMELGCGDMERLMVGKFLVLSFSRRKVFSGSL